MRRALMDQGDRNGQKLFFQFVNLSKRAWIMIRVADPYLPFFHQEVRMCMAVAFCLADPLRGMV